MIHGAHVILFSTDADADRAFFRDVLAYPSVDAGGGWLIFALPPAEVAVHPAESNGTHELYFMCDDVNAFVAEMAAKELACSEIDEQRWGSITRLTLPGGGTIGVYQPKHPSPVAAPKKMAPARKGGARKAATKKGAAKKAATRKGAAKKAATRKGAAKKAATRRGAAKKAATRRGAAKKSPAKKGRAKKRA